MPITKTIELYRIGELAGVPRANAIHDVVDSLAQSNDWAASLIDGFIRELKEEGVRVKLVPYHVAIGAEVAGPFYAPAIFWSDQTSTSAKATSFAGTVDLQTWLSQQKLVHRFRRFFALADDYVVTIDNLDGTWAPDIEARIEHYGTYPDGAKGARLVNREQEIELLIRDWARDRAEDIGIDIRNEWMCQTSDDVIAERLDEGDVLFHKDGRVFIG